MPSLAGKCSLKVDTLQKKTKLDILKIICPHNRERRPTWAEERRLNAETFGIPLGPNRGRGGYRGRGGLGFRGGRGSVAVAEAVPSPVLEDFGGFRGGRGAGSLQILSIGGVLLLVLGLACSCMKLKMF